MTLLPKYCVSYFIVSIIIIILRDITRIIFLEKDTTTSFEMLIKYPVKHATLRNNSVLNEKRRTPQYFIRRVSKIRTVSSRKSSIISVNAS